jgi:hypothetical protein
MAIQTEYGEIRADIARGWTVDFLTRLRLFLARQSSPTRH